MKRTPTSLLIVLSFAMLGSSLSSSIAQGRYGYRTAPNGDCEVIDHRYSRTPILDRIRQDLRVVHEEVNRAVYGTRDEVRRTVHGGPPADVYDLSVNPSWGRFDDQYLAEVRRRKAHEDQQRARYEAGIRAERYRIEQMEADREAQRVAQSRADNLARRHAEVAQQQEREREVARQREIQNEMQRRAKFEREQKAAKQKAAAKLAAERKQRELERQRIVRPREESETKTETRPPEPMDSPVDPVVQEKPQQEARNEAGFTPTEMKNFPFATKTDKPGFVKSPYPPHELLDVTDIEAGGLAMEPDSDRIFRIPE